MPEATPLVRALQTLEAIQDHPGITAARLAGATGVTERAVRRQIAALREAGVPIEASRGPYGGYRVGRGARLPPVVFTEEEAIALVTAVLAVTAGQDPPDVRRRALDKVVRALPPRTRRQAAGVRDTATGAGRPDPLPDPGVTSALVAAIGESRRVVLD